MHSPQGASTKVRFNTRTKHSFQPNTRSINANIQQHKAHVICNCVSGGSFDTHGGALLGIVILKQRVCKIGHMTNVTLVPSLWNGQCHRNSFTSATTQLGRDTFFMKLENQGIHPRNNNLPTTGPIHNPSQKITNAESAKNSYLPSFNIL